MQKIGVIINNIGTPDSPSSKDVGKYLGEFLMDPDVISIPYIFRLLLVKGLIVPLRKKTSAHKYQIIWTSLGSPLMFHSQNFASRLQEQLGPNYEVKIGMRYGTPNITAALEEFRRMGIQKVILAPMFPQYADATTGSANKKMIFEVSRFKQLYSWDFSFVTVPPFFARDFFISSKSGLIKKALSAANFDHIVFSYHGLPESQLKKNGCLVNSACCFSDQSCQNNCYKAQCHESSKKLALSLGLADEQWTTSFQSRLGPTKWIGPATSDVCANLARKAAKVAVVCPAFVSDCLETLEEIQVELRDQFISNGGKEFVFIPCLNDDPNWVSGFANFIRDI